MSTSMPPEERNKIISNNRSLRNIKNELETLAENGAISDEAFDAIMKNLPAESSFNAGPTRKNPPARASAPEPSMEKLSLDNQPPPAYQKAPTPTLPSRNNYSAPQPEVMRATALYAYSAEGDCNFNVGDEIIVLKLVNDDWWVGKNARTNSEGAFPKTYVQPHNSPPEGNQYPNEKANTGGHQAQGYQGYRQNGPPPPGPSDPYNSAVPPMQMANDPMEGKPGKGGEMGKKFGKKLGNAAIFGAGATIGGNIVNSIF